MWIKWKSPIINKQGEDKNLKKEEQLEKLKKSLGEESAYLKDCLSKYSFYAMGGALTSFVFIFRFMFENNKKPDELNDIVGFASIAVMILMLSVSRICVYKQVGANRNDGYRLHLERTNSLLVRTDQFNKTDFNKWHNEMRYAGWQEAMRAWRIVQACLFRKMYDYHNSFLRHILPHRLKEEYKGSQGLSDQRRDNMLLPYTWFIPGKIVKTSSGYHAGGYLGKLLKMMYFVVLVAFLIVTYSAWKMFELKFSIFFSISIFLICVWRLFRDFSMNQALEHELLSIPSCAILWQAVIFAHFRACEAAKHYNFYGAGYSWFLSVQAEEIAKYPLELHHWIKEPTPDYENLVNNRPPFFK